MRGNPTVAYTPQDKLSVADKARRQAVQAQVRRFLRRFAVIHTGGESRTIDLIEKMFVDLAKRFRSRPGGYTRIIKIGRRRGDNAPMVIIELLQESDAKAKADIPAEPEKVAEAKAGEPKAEAALPAEAAAVAAAEAAPEEERTKKAQRVKKKAEAGEEWGDRLAC